MSSESHGGGGRHGRVPDVMRLPQSLERVLAGMDRRVEEIGVRRDELDEHILGVRLRREVVKEEEAEEASLPKSVVGGGGGGVDRKKKRKQRKLAKQRRREEAAERAQRKAAAEAVEEDVVMVEYVPEELPVDRSDPFFSYFRSVAQHFKQAGASKQSLSAVGLASKYGLKGFGTGMKIRDRTLLGDDDDDVASQKAEKKVSKKQMKKMTRLSVAELKQLVRRPDVVEMHDVTARDPRLLVHLKSLRNTVPVPRHWCGKRKYLQGKRGYVKSPFDLPEFIKRTGIMEMRQSVQDDHKSLKQKMRERIRPKLGKIEIDYQKLHDAFFKFQTKPALSIHGDLYYEGKENEVKLQQAKPGGLSDELRTALGMSVGVTVDRVPPPWLIAMQRYGPPPSYPNLKIPGLNSPIPDGCSFGYHPGGWGKPPVDEMGRPLYGDVFGTLAAQAAQEMMMSEVDEQVDKTPWGEVEDEDEADEEEDEEAGESTAFYVHSPTTNLDGIETPSGITSVAPSTAGMETPLADNAVDIRKRKFVIDPIMDDDTTTLFTVIPEKETSVGNELMGSSKVYDLNAAKQTEPNNNGVSLEKKQPISERPDDETKRKKKTNKDGSSSVANRREKEFKF